jgi:hypothetical protein
MIVIAYPPKQLVETKGYKPFGMLVKVKDYTSKNGKQFQTLVVDKSFLSKLRGRLWFGVEEWLLQRGYELKIEKDFSNVPKREQKQLSMF